MKKTFSLVLVLLFVVVTGIYFTSTYNGFVTLDESVNEKWAQVQNAYQRRSDLIPNLVSTVKGYAAHEKETLEAVIKARASATQTKISAEGLSDPATLAHFQAAQGALSSALSKLMVVIEKYPELKANQNFLALQSQLEGTENRISVERKRFNETVKNYNTKVRHFPGKLVASLFGFEKKVPFQATTEAQTVPKVQF